MFRKNLIVEKYIICNLKLKWKNLLLKHISRKIFKTLKWNGKIYIPYLDVQRLTQIFAYFSINYYVIFYILTKCFTNLEERYFQFALFAWKSLKAQFIFSFLHKNNFLKSFYDVLIIPPITPQSAVFGFTDHKVNYHLIKQILLILKYYVYKTRENGSLNLQVLQRIIHKKNIAK